MKQLMQYFKEPSNDADHRQARVWRAYMIACLLDVKATDKVRFYNENGIAYREAMYQ